MNIHVSGLFFYPVKSCAGIARKSLKLTAFGPDWDRHWMIVDEHGRFRTQREFPELARIKTRIDSRSLTLIAPNGRCRIPSQADGPAIETQVWKHHGPAIDAGDEAARFLSDFLGKPSRLVRLTPNHERRSSTGARISFTDSAPLLLISQTSLERLNEKLDSPLPMDRFRPNIVLEGGTAYQEDNWKRVRIGRIELERAKPCTRCAITTVDQASGVRLGPEPLKTLATYRRLGAEVAFGYYFQFNGVGTIRIGDAVAPLE